VVLSALIFGLLTAAFVVGIFFPAYDRVAGYSAFESGTIFDQQISDTLATEGLKGIPQERMVIYNGYISPKTSDIQGILTKMRSVAEKYDGYVAASCRSQGRGEVTIRVSKSEFRGVIQEIETFGRVMDERTSSDDVTEQYVDLNARLEFAEAGEDAPRNT
jgi:hypothetical protein